MMPFQTLKSTQCQADVLQLTLALGRAAMTGPDGDSLCAAVPLSARHAHDVA